MNRIRLGWMRQWPKASLALSADITAMESRGHVLVVSCADGTVWHVRKFGLLMVGWWVNA